MKNTKEVLLERQEYAKHVVVRRTCTIPDFREIENRDRLMIDEDRLNSFITSGDNVFEPEKNLRVKEMQLRFAVVIYVAEYRL